MFLQSKVRRMKVEWKDLGVDRELLQNIIEQTTYR